jgi:hypothetical protein
MLSTCIYRDAARATDTPLVVLPVHGFTFSGNKLKVGSKNVSVFHEMVLSEIHSCFLVSRTIPTACSPAGSV